MNRLICITVLLALLAVVACGRGSTPPSLPGSSSALTTPTAAPPVSGPTFASTATASLMTTPAKTQNIEVSVAFSGGSPSFHQHLTRSCGTPHSVYMREEVVVQDERGKVIGAARFHSDSGRSKGGCTYFATLRNIPEAERYTFVPINARGFGRSYTWEELRQRSWKVALEVLMR